MDDEIHSEIQTHTRRAWSGANIIAFIHILGHLYNMSKHPMIDTDDYAKR